MAKLVGPLTMEQLTGKVAMESFTRTHGQQKAISDGQNSIRAMRVETNPCELQDRIFEAATEAEEQLTTQRMGVCQQAFLVGRLNAALGHLG